MEIHRKMRADLRNELHARMQDQPATAHDENKLHIEDHELNLKKYAELVSAAKSSSGIDDEEEILSKLVAENAEFEQAVIR
jgi:hypothetical protein